MRIVLLGTRGVPAHYGGFETAVEEVGRRLAARGHDVVVYCRGAEKPRPSGFLGMQLVHLPAAKRKSLETLSHTLLSTVHLATTRRRRFDAAIVFNAANAPFLPVLRLSKVPTALHVDGLEWKRAKWQGAGRRYYRMVEGLSVRWADALIADASGIANYYEDEFGASTELIAYGAPIQDCPGSDRIETLGLRPRQYHLVVARFEPENHVLEIVQGYRQSQAKLPLVVVGSAPYAGEYTAAVREAAAGDERIRLLGGVWDQDQLDELYGNALSYLHGHCVGGTNPSLLRAMGAGTCVIAYDVNFNRDVLGDGTFFTTPDQLAVAIEQSERDPTATVEQGCRNRERARDHYCWDEVANRYEELLQRLAAGHSIRGRNSGKRQPSELSSH